MSISERDIQEFEKFALEKLQEGNARSMLELVKEWELKESGDHDAKDGSPSPSAQAMLEHYADEQGVTPVKRFEDLVGDFLPEDDNVDQFLEQIFAARENDPSRGQLND